MKKISKLTARLPSEFRISPKSLRSEFSARLGYDPPSPPQPHSEIALTLGVAVQRRWRVQMRYRSHREETERGVDPYGLVLRWNHWYLVGWCHLRQAVRVFRIDRIMSPLVEEATFERPEAFDSLQYVLESLATAPWGFAVEALLMTTLEDARWRIPPGSAVLEETDGVVVMRAYVERLDCMSRWLLAFGCPFVIRHPKELRDALRQVASEAMALAEA